VKFGFAVPVAVSPARAVAAYSSPSFYESRDDIAVLGAVEHGGALEVHYRFKGHVSGAVRAVVDPAKLSWLTRMSVLADELRCEWDIVPDHYPDRLSSSGRYTFGADPRDGTGAGAGTGTGAAAGAKGTIVGVEGALTVHVPFVGRSVERSIVSGLRNYIESEVASIPDFTG
jgi:hypothetical protein